MLHLGKEFIHLNIRRTSAHTGGCIFPCCGSTETLTSIPKSIRITVMRTLRIFLPQRARVCKDHLGGIEMWRTAILNEGVYKYNAKQVGDMINLLCSSTAQKILDAEGIYHLQ